MPVNILGYEVPVWAVIAAPLASAYYTYLTWHYGIFKKMGLKHPRPIPILGTMLPMITKGRFEEDMALFKKYGKVFGTFRGRRPVMVVADPEILKEIMIKRFNFFTNRLGFDTDEYITSKMLLVLQDDHWKYVRNLMTPSFSTRKLRTMTSHIQRCSKVLVNHLMIKAESGESFEFKEYTGAFTMDIIACTGFGLDIDSQSDSKNPFIEHATKTLNFSFTNPSLLLLFVFPGLFMVLSRLGIAHFFPYRCLKFFERVVNEAIEQRIKMEVQESDFLQLMMKADLVDTEADDDQDHETDPNMTLKDQSLRNRQGLTREEIVAQSIVFILAGYETTATTLAFTGYCLATNPDCQEIVIEEIDRVMKGQTDPDYDLVKSMPYLDMFLSETLRMYPAVPRMTRVTSEDVTINGLFIPKDMIVALPFYLLHHDPDAWPEPEQFRPERFTAEEKAKRHPNQWMPFGAGPRHCLGMRLAMLELKVATVYLLQNFRFKTCDKTQIPIKLTKMRMGAKGGIYLKLEKRMDSTS